MGSRPGSRPSDISIGPGVPDDLRVPIAVEILQSNYLTVSRSVTENWVREYRVATHQPNRNLVRGSIPSRNG